MRTFVAIELPRDIKRSLERVSRDLKGLELHGRQTRVEGIHLTLKFLGELAEEQIPLVEEALLASTVESSPFELQIGGIGVFPHLARPRVVWVGVAGSEPLKLLQLKVEDSLAAVGFKRENRSFRPHLTLMRLKSPKNVARLVRFIRDYHHDPLGVVTVTRIHLYQSILQPEGARYHQLRTFNL